MEDDEHFDKSPPRIKGNIVGCNDTDEYSISDDETSDQAESSDVLVTTNVLMVKMKVRKMK